MIINLIKSLQSRTPPPQNTVDLSTRTPELDTRSPALIASDLKSPKDAPESAVSVTGFAGFTIGETVIPYSNNEKRLVDNNKIVDIEGKKFTVGFLKTQIENYKQSSFPPTGAITHQFVHKSWGGGSVGINAFERFMGLFRNFRGRILI